MDRSEIIGELVKKLCITHIKEIYKFLKAPKTINSIFNFLCIFFNVHIQVK